MKIRAYTKLTPQLLKEWRSLSASSSLSHFFNSPAWFLACLEAFQYSQILIIACYSGSQLVGLLPLVKGKKAGFPAFVSPGNQYFDRSSFLLKNLDLEVVRLMLGKLAQKGSFSLKELPEEFSVMASQSLRQAKVVPCSSGSFLPITSEPFPNMAHEHRRRIANKISKLGSALEFHAYGFHAIKQLPVLIGIENQSHKKALFKDILSDPGLGRLLRAIDRQNPRALLVDILYYGGVPICFQIGFNHKQVHSGFATAFHEGYRSLLPGKVSTYLLVKYLYTIGMSVIDMSRGESMFKKDLSSISYAQYEAFYSTSPVVMSYWQLVEFVKSILSRSAAIFEFARYSKNFLFRRILSI